jgi:hypothetical protein
MEKVKSCFSHPFDLITIHKFNAIMRTETNDQRLCEVHKEPVILEYHNYDSNSFGAAPFEVVLIGCCNFAIEKEWEFINQTVEHS